MTLEVNLLRIEDSRLWKKFRDANETLLLDTVNSVAENAASLLADIAHQMPLYAKHSERHILNVIWWMQCIQDYSIEQLSPILF